MAAYGSSDKSLADKKGIQTGQGMPPTYMIAAPPGYTSAPTAPPYYATYAGYPPAAAYPYPQGPPPPYSVAVSQPSPLPGYPTYASYGYPCGIPLCSQPLPPTQHTLVMPASYDAGARFDGVARHVIPPPPPGAVPNAAQLAMMQGSTTAVVTQQKANFLTGGSDGGYTFW